MAVADHFARVWEMYEQAIHQFAAEAWRTSDVEYLAPARLVYHAAEAAEFYSGMASEGFAWGARFGADWEAASANQLPTQDKALCYLDEVRSRVDVWLREMTDADLLAPDAAFPWTGGTVLHRVLYLLRHTQHHLGEINVELRRKGLPRAEWR